MDVVNSDVDVIHVCTPNRSHCEISCAAMEAGKHVLCEKPMAINAAEARKMYETSVKTGVTSMSRQRRKADFSVTYIWRAHTPYAAARFRPGAYF